MAWIWSAWFRVKPVTANSSRPARHRAELIQCHCRNWLRQKAGQKLVEAGGEGDEDMDTDSQLTLILIINMHWR